MDHHYAARSEKDASRDCSARNDCRDLAVCKEGSIGLDGVKQQIAYLLKRLLTLDISSNP